ncbi:NAD-dependent epimerase/dehydratase family protein [Agrobacterium sp. RAC06]|uniref:NAD-dependent epimerase/dehydratase family protein n=1 Tax=Agrobacterium sp. RAC06 TaxID=1842536 RepID=UPI00083D0866|nr:NAD(P)-dependent oxidoreductase [Agrobacterium sp. RAC06]AOG08860.1 3-beta hydroxysteroid dehydrogenase/isomerase family protein [Agrobacterium sp. RAC06]
MRVLVTGATGFLGGRLIRYLAARGFETVGLGRDEARCRHLQDLGFATVCADMSRPVLHLVDEIGTVDAVVHCAALSASWGKPAAFRLANVEGTGHVLDLAHALKVRRFVNISSPTVYFELKDKTDVAETALLPPPINAYARTKAEAEAMVLARGSVGPVNLRPRGIYGLGDQTLLPRITAAARHGPLPLLRSGAAAIDLTHVDDVVQAIEAALTISDIEGQTFNISSGEMVPVRHIVERVCSRLAIELRWRRVPFYPALAAARLVELVSLARSASTEPLVTPYTLGLFAFRQSLDISKARRMLGWRPRISFEEGLAMTIAQGRGP